MEGSVVNKVAAGNDFLCRLAAGRIHPPPDYKGHLGGEEVDNGQVAGIRTLTFRLENAPATQIEGRCSEVCVDFRVGR
jgi:hypothetical protein